MVHIYTKNEKNAKLDLPVLFTISSTEAVDALFQFSLWVELKNFC